MTTLPNSQEHDGKQNMMEALWNAEPQAPDRATRQVRRLASAGFLCRSRGFFTVKLGETWKMPPVTTGAEMDLKWWKAIKRVVMSAECPNHVGNWKLFESPRSSMSSCHGHFSTSLPPSPWNSCLAGHQGISRIFWHFPKANPRHPTAPPKALGTCC